MGFPKFPNPKDADDVVDYEFDWTKRLIQGDTITASAFTIVQGSATILKQGNTTTKTTVWIEGGTEGEVVLVQNRIETNGGRQWDQTVGIKIKTQ